MLSYGSKVKRGKGKAMESIVTYSVKVYYAGSKLGEGFSDTFHGTHSEVVAYRRAAILKGLSVSGVKTHYTYA